MAQKVVGYIKLQIPAGKATPAPNTNSITILLLQTSKVNVKIVAHY